MGPKASVLCFPNSKIYKAGYCCFALKYSKAARLACEIDPVVPALKGRWGQFLPILLEITRHTHYTVNNT